jgi:3-keto-5-aminohexanoate cleavage enzyme
VSLEDPVILTCAISGALANRAQCPAIPYTPAEYAAEARRAVDTGAVHLHIHARTPEGEPSVAVGDFLAIRHAIVAEIGDSAIINFSTGTVGVDVATRVAYLAAGAPEVAALNLGSMNYAKYSRSRHDFVFQFVFENPWEEILELLRAMVRLDITPEYECFDIGHVASLAPLVDLGVVRAPLHADFIMGVLGGIPATVRNLEAMIDNYAAVVAGTGDQAMASHWGVIGIGRSQWQMIAGALVLGGSIRAGVEDNFYLPDGSVARSNGELVAKAAQMTLDCGRRLASVQEARHRLGVRRLALAP